MIFDADVGGPIKVVSVSSFKPFQALIKKHIEDRAYLCKILTRGVVFDAGIDELTHELVELIKLGADGNQCLLLYFPDDREAIWDALYAWTQFGGCTLPIIHNNIQRTLEALEGKLKDFNMPVTIQPQAAVMHYFDLKEQEEEMAIFGGS